MATFLKDAELSVANFVLVAEHLVYKQMRIEVTKDHNTIVYDSSHHKFPPQTISQGEHHRG
jgi:hypothetical protein